jgi:hypothetical protein
MEAVTTLAETGKSQMFKLLETAKNKTRTKKQFAERTML